MALAGIRRDRIADRCLAGVPAQPPPAQPSANAKSSYDQIAPVLLGKGTFKEVMAKDKADKAAVMDRQKKLLEERYDLTATRPTPRRR